MGSVAAKLRRPLRRFNIDNRARTVISKEKPTPAPKPDAAIKQLKLAKELNPNFLENHYKKDVKLDENLKNVYVTSTDPEVITTYQPRSEKPLPQSRMSMDFDFGFFMPHTVPEGKCTLKQIFDIIIRHKEDSIKNNVNFLATEYKLDKETVEKLLNYYKLYYLASPPKEEGVEEDDEKRLIDQFNLIRKLGVYPWDRDRNEKRK